MGFVKSTSSTRCRYAACFTLGFVVASLILVAMFWIIWCYLGLTIVQISDTQRRAAVVNYSFTTSKPPTTLRPSNRTEVDGALESSLNAISKSPVTPPTQPRRRSNTSTDLAKGDFAARHPGGVSQNSTKRESVTPSVTPSTHEQKSSVLSGEEGGLHTRKISTSNTENRAHEESLPARDIKPTQTYVSAQSDPLPIAPRNERRPISRDSDRIDEIQSSRPAYRDPEFEREPPRRSEPGRRRYSDEDDYDDRGSPSRYDKRDRGRDTDDRYSKGDTRVYPDERPRLDDRYPPRDSDRRRGDDRDLEDRYRNRDDRYRDDDRYETRDDRYRDDDRYEKRDYRYRDDDRYEKRDDRYRDDDRYEKRDDRYRDDDRYETRRRDDPYDDKYRTRNDQYDDRYVSRDSIYVERRKDSAYDDRIDRRKESDDEYRYSRSRDRDYGKPITSSRDDIPLDRKSGRPDDARRPIDYDEPVRDRSRTSYLDESRPGDRYPYRDDDYQGSSKYDDGYRIYPSRTREESYILRSTESMSRSRDDGRYSSNRDTSRYDVDDRRVGESRYISPSSIRETDSTRRDINRDIQDYGGLERRSSSAEEVYRQENSRTRYTGDADRKSSEDSRPGYHTDGDYTRRTRTEDDDYRRDRPRGDLDTDRPRIPEKYDPPMYNEDIPSSRSDEPRRRIADVGLRKESYPRDTTDEDRTSVPRPEGRRPVPPPKDRRYDDDSPRRSISDDRPFRSISDTFDDRPLRPAVERTSEDRRPYRDDRYPEDDRDDSSRYVPSRSRKREPFDIASTSPRDVVAQDKGYHSSGRNYDAYDKDEARPINAKDVIDAANKHPDAPNQNSRDVYYPVFNPRAPNLTSTDIILPGERRGTTIMSRRRRSRIYLPYSSTLQRDVVIRKKRDLDSGNNFDDYGNEVKHSESPARRMLYPINIAYRNLPY